MTLWRLMVLALLVVPVWGHAQGVGDDMVGRLDRLERRLMALEGRTLPSTPGSAGVAGTALADMEQRMQELEQENSQMNGGVERLSNAVERLAKKVDELAKDFDLRLRDLEAAAQAGGTGGGQVVAGPKAEVKAEAEAPAAEEASPAEEAAAASPTAVKGGTKVAIPEGMKPEEHYNRAYAYLTAADYPNAQGWLEEFIKRYPKNDLADNAYYWLGEVHLVQNNPKGALVSFKTGLDTFPKGQKAPANLLKMGVALEQVGKPDLAKGAWQKLIKDFPKSPEAEKARAKMAELPKDAAKTKETGKK